MSETEGETDPIRMLAAGSARRAVPNLTPLPPAGRTPVICFNRRELDEIFGLYGHMVAAGEWRDYAIDMQKDKAVFSVFRRSCERPVYVIEKRPQLSRKQGAYCVVAMTGLILRRGHDLVRVLRVLKPKPKLVRA
jgi:hypothetical protein